MEAILAKQYGCKMNDMNNRSYTQAYQKYLECRSSYIVLCSFNDMYSEPIQIYRGPDAVYKFMENLLKEVDWCKNIVNKSFNKPLVMTEDDIKAVKRQINVIFVVKILLKALDALKTILNLMGHSLDQLIANVALKLR